MPHARDPLPYPRYENDMSFQGKDAQSLCNQKPFLLKSGEDPWDRLSATQSSTKKYFCYNPKHPPDSLDFHLKTMYNHYNGFFKNRNETLFQAETFTPNHGKKLKKRAKELAMRTSQEEKPAIREWVSPQKIDVNSIDGAITSPHSAATNRGYSRKKDGGYYSS